MVDQRLFLLEALTQVNNNTFPFQQHLKGACDLLPPPTRACFLSFEQLTGQQMVLFQNSISKCLHHHNLSKCSLTRYMKPIVPKFYHVLVKG